MVVSKSAPAFLLTGVVATVAGLLIERYVPDNRKAPIYSSTTDAGIKEAPFVIAPPSREELNRRTLAKMDWERRANDLVDTVEAKGVFRLCRITKYAYEERYIVAGCTRAADPYGAELTYFTYYVD
mgnify:CR=1 FL=1